MQFNFSEINVRKKIKTFNEKFTRVTITSDSISNQQKISLIHKFKHLIYMYKHNILYIFTFQGNQSLYIILKMTLQNQSTESTIL